MWRVRWHEIGKVRRKFFSSRAVADSFAAKLRGEKLTARQRLALMPDAVLQTMLAAHDEAVKRGVNMLAAVAGANVAVVAPAVEDVITEIGGKKRTAGMAESYVSRLEQISKAFAKGRERLPVDQFTFLDVEAFLDAHNINYRQTLRSKLSTLFKFCVRRGYRIDNPCERLEKIKAPHVVPDIFTVKEMETCLKSLKRHPKLLAWFALSTLAGLRPAEAQKTRWGEISLDEGWIRVEAQTTKVRQRRVVYPLPMAIEWLAFAKSKKSVLPMSSKLLAIYRCELKKALKWKLWKFDVTRHTAASYWLAQTGEAAKIATALGHSESILRKNYMALVTKADAEKFWSLSPVKKRLRSIRIKRRSISHGKKTR